MAILRRLQHPQSNSGRRRISSFRSPQMGLKNHEKKPTIPEKTTASEIPSPERPPKKRKQKKNYKSVHVSFMASPKDVEKWRDLAFESGDSLSGWVRSVLQKEARLTGRRKRPSETA